MRETPSLRRPDKRRSSRQSIFQLAIAVGVAGAGYIYGVAFDDLSEEQLVQLSAVWVLPVVFGVYGYVAERLLQLVDADDGVSLAQATLIWTRALPVIGAVLLLPFLFAKGRTAVSIAFWGTLFWALLLVGFFVWIFPLL